MSKWKPEQVPIAEKINKLGIWRAHPDSQSLLLKRIKASNFWVRQFIKRYKQPASGATHQENNSANSRKCAHQDNEFPKFLFSASKESPGVDDPSASVTSTSDKKRTRKISSQSPQNDHDNDAGGRDNIASRNLASDSSDEANESESERGSITSEMQ
ncbi:hypothetical protein PPTG_23156 [Phytophthora nicotianae INRA-310]|uniref:Uncharacterized protein n=1 Tax=Phytophthora nicotianae (strain INRA-310) TaxID=761204 RepID=W2Q563_PHYN3|nr:hypothetical protein PPTG_23156 [Phytophthora nicotianae INRA-310]ETN07704.1 hypothetical protein PPTG_23156 [Phytophthora nicotianae INRA-310]